MITAPPLYTQADVARKLRTHIPRTREMVERAGVVPARVAGLLVFTEEQFQAVRRAHRETPRGKPGRPRKGAPAANAG